MEPSRLVAKSSLKNILVNIVRWAVPLGIVAYLVYDVSRSDTFEQVLHGPRDWGLLGLALILFLSAHLLTIFRWYLLVRSIGIPFSLKDAMRLGFLGYLLTFVSLGAIGGDLIRAFFVAREQPQRRKQAAATVIVDRVLGLYSLFLLATIAIVTTGTWNDAESLGLEVICRITFACTAIATAGFAWILCGGGRRLGDWLGKIPRLGTLIRQLFGAIEIYRRSWKIVLVSILIGIAVQTLLALTIHTTAGALVSTPPSLVEHLIIVPLAMLTALLPLPGQGLGAFELVLEYLYRKFAPGTPIGQGLLAAFGYRLVMIATALISSVVYAMNRREVREVMHEAEVESERLEARA